MIESGAGASHNKKRNTGTTGRLSELQERMRAKLEGAKFRLLNEQLYTTRGDEAFKAFASEPSLFDVYHRGYREQVAKWPENPLDHIIAWVGRKHAAKANLRKGSESKKAKSSSPRLAIADFGCGDAVLAEKCAALANCKVHSFDLVARRPSVTACDMAAVPLPPNSVDIAVFCLSLMGTNMLDYLVEARRVLRKDKPVGVLKIAEVRSRLEGPGEASGFCDGVGKRVAEVLPGSSSISAAKTPVAGLQYFIEQIESLGFKCVERNKKNKMFVILEFELLQGSVGDTDCSTRIKKKSKHRNAKGHGVAVGNGASSSAIEATVMNAVPKTVDEPVLLAKPCFYKRR